MKIKELQRKLLEAYTTENLNGLSLTLINLYKNKQYSILQKIADIISDAVEVEILDDGKGFSKLMMLYHPDRATFHTNEINRLAKQDNYDGLLEYSHILLLSRIDEIANTLNGYEDIDYSPVYEWDFNTEGFSIINDNNTKKTSAEHSEKENTSTRFYNFYDAVKVRMFDSTDKEYPSYYLEDIDEFELASSDINDLEGIEYCKHVKNLDLSNNHICDITPLFGLRLLEEINLSDNDITDIDALCNLENLRVIHLANNNIDDISPIMNLPWLEYVDLSGTKVSEKQVKELRELGVTIIFY
ncbi:MAG: leucine-rich repeat domain-containing protein [Tenuifilaceae bacterium]